MSVKQTSIYLKRRNLTCLALLLLVLICLSSCTPAAAINVACDVSDLIDAINVANSNTDTTKLILSPNCIYPITNVDNTDGGAGPNGFPQITTIIKIEGNNAILTKQHAFGNRFFFITNNGNLRLEDITLENGYSFSGDHPNSRGGAIYNDGGALRAERSIFLDNHAPGGDGGAIYNRGVLTLEDTLFDINSSDNGGAIYHSGSLGTIVVIENVTFENNFALDNGGAIYSNSAEVNFLITGSTFYSNSTYHLHGGAIYMDGGDLEIYNSEFLENTAGFGVGPDPVPDWGDGGAIYSLAGDVTLIATNFNMHTALGVGGILYAGPGSDVRLRDVTSETSRACHGGGALYVEGETEILETTIMKGNAGGNGSDWGWDYLDIHHQECLDNHGGAVYNAGTLVLDRSLIFKSHAMGDGDGVYNLDDLTVVNSTFFYSCCGDEEAINNHGSAELSLSTLMSSGLVNSGTMTVKNIVVAAYTNGCINSGTLVDLDQNIALDSACPFSTILAGMVQLKIDMISLSDNGGPTLTNRVKWDSPVIGNATCSTVSGDPVTEDQRGESRPFPGPSIYNCDIGAFELHDFTHEPLPPPAPPPPMPDVPPDDSSENCDPFEDLEISVVLLNVPADTLVLPLYFRFFDGVPGQDEAEPWKFRATLGDPGEIESYRCGLQGFDDRLYCMFNLPPDVPGLALDLLLYKDDCGDPSYTLPKVTIPELKGSIQDSIPDPKLQCSKDLNKDACEAAGGTMSDGVSEAPYCICP